MPLPKLKDIPNWTPEVEKQITDSWKSAEMFKLDMKKLKKIYSIDTPPPYINTPIHMGHATTYAFMDFIARHRRMTGHSVLFPLGLDRNGLPIELAAEKKFNTTPFKEGREKFVALCEQLLKETSAESIDSFSKLGISFTSYNQSKDVGAVYLTDSPEYRALTQATFIDLFKKERIYEAKRVNNWDPKLQTTVADAEIEYKDIPSTFNHVKWKVKETGEEIIIATTRPELICTCGAVIYNPKDERYQHLEGKTAITPLYGIEVPIMEHPFAKVDKGSGIVMMCMGGDVTDIQFFRELSLPSKIAVNQDGRLNEDSGFLKGLKVKEGREKIIDELKKEGLLVKQEQIVHSTPVSERSGAEIEFIEMPEYYLKQLEIKDKVRKISNDINFYPPEAKKILDSWLDSVAIDWPISRRRFYATPIPLWHYEDLTAVPDPGKYYVPWKEQPPKESDVYKNGELVGKVSDFNVSWKAEERVLDTWFDSSISELYILKYKENPEFFNKAYPATLRPQGKEIVRTWLYYTLLRGYLETGKACFKDVWIHQHILDEKGRKMSKSVGNVIDPHELLRDYGAEAMRFWAAIEGDLSKGDFACSKEKIRAEVKTMNKLLNVSRFVMQFPKPAKAKPTELDKIFLDYINSLTSKAAKEYEEYDFHHTALKLRAFLWDIFASHYIEIVKNRAYNAEGKFSKTEQDAAVWTLHELLERFIVLAYPIIPQITSVIAEEKGIDLHSTIFPDIKEIKDSSLESIQKIIDFNSAVWKAKRDKSISLKEKISGIEIPTDLKAFASDLKACHNLI